MDPPADQPSAIPHCDSMPSDHGKSAEASAGPVHPEQSMVVGEAPTAHTIDEYDGEFEELNSVGSVSSGLCARLIIT